MRSWPRGRSATSISGSRSNVARAIIIGAGIGGLTAALTLHEEGWEVDIHEAVASLPVGARGLRGLGPGDRLYALAIRPRAMEYRTKFGHLLLSDPRGVEAGFDHPQYSVHRGELQFLILDAVMDRIGIYTVHSGH